MKNLLLTALSAAALLCVAGCREEPISRIIIFKRDNLIADISDPGKLARMEKLLEDREPAAIPLGHRFTYLVMTADSTNFRRWDYNADGYFNLLTIEKNPESYRLRNPGEFNKLVGITR